MRNISAYKTSNISAYKKNCANSIPLKQLIYSLKSTRKFPFFTIASISLKINVRKNLLKGKRFFFTSFSSSKLFDEVNVQTGEITWKLFHDIFEKDLNLQANLKATPITRPYIDKARDSSFSLI